MSSSKPAAGGVEHEFTVGQAVSVDASPVGDMCLMPRTGVIKKLGRYWATVALDRPEWDSLEQVQVTEMVASYSSMRARK